MMPVRLDGKRAIVGGATRGIGRAIAQEFAALGASVTLLGRNETALKETAQVLPETSGQAHAYVCADFSDPESLRSSVARHLAETGPVHILVNNTGGPAPGPLVEASSAAFKEAFSSHLLCNHFLVQTVLPGMKTLGAGRIVNIVSTSVREPLPGLGVSNTTRGAVASWAKTLSGELGPLGITVNNVLPGPTETDRLQSIIERKAKEHGRSIDEERDLMKRQLPVRRLGKPEEVAYAVCFLVSDAAAFITGVSLAVDGGRMACI